MFLPKKKKKNKKKIELTEEQQKWNKMWELWANSKADSPFSEIMTYQSEVNNGGHGQYFSNLSDSGDLENDVRILKNALPEKHRQNFERAYAAYSNSENQINSEHFEEITEQCDIFFYEYEEEINTLLNTYALKITL